MNVLLSPIISVSLKWSEISRTSGTQHPISNGKRKCRIIPSILLRNSHHWPVCGHETVPCTAFTFRGPKWRKSSLSASHFWRHLPTIPVACSLAISTWLRIILYLIRVCAVGKPSLADGIAVDKAEILRDERWSQHTVGEEWQREVPSLQAARRCLWINEKKLKTTCIYQRHLSPRTHGYDCHAYYLLPTYLHTYPPTCLGCF